jgi:hypothetical protein
MHPDEPCRCGHERKWHDSCSKCLCPFFLDPGRVPADVLRLWKRERKVRQLRETEA